MIGSQPVPNWPEFQNDPSALNIRKGVFRSLRTNQYELYLLDGNTQLVSIMFDSLDDAINALNDSQLIKIDGIWKLKIKKMYIN